MTAPIRSNGLTSAAAALRFYERRQEVLSNNLANVSTTGFKGERVFARMVGDAIAAPDSATDQRMGALRPTGAPLDLALDGTGYLVVATPDGERLSRGGSFSLDETGRVIDANGHPLLTDGGAIVASANGSGTVSIGRDGQVSVDGRGFGRLRIETVPPGTRLQHDAGSLWIPDATRRPAEVRPVVRQGFVEESNVSTVESMVDMISVQRAYATVQKAITTLDGVRGTATNELGKPV